MLTVEMGVGMLTVKEKLNIINWMHLWPKMLG